MVVGWTVGWLMAGFTVILPCKDFCFFKSLYEKGISNLMHSLKQKSNKKFANCSSYLRDRNVLLFMNTVLLGSLSIQT